MTYTLPEVCAVPSWSPCRFRDEGPVGGDLRVPWPALGKARSEHARDPLSFPLGRVGPAVQPGAQFRQTNAEGLGGSPAAPPTAFELRAQPCSDGAFEVPAVDLVEDPLDAFFTGLHIHPSAHDRSVLNSRPCDDRRTWTVEGKTNGTTCGPPSPVTVAIRPTRASRALAMASDRVTRGLLEVGSSKQRR
jgi:hypothetical protein